MVPCMHMRDRRGQADDTSSNIMTKLYPICASRLIAEMIMCSGWFACRESGVHNMLSPLSDHAILHGRESINSISCSHMSVALALFTSRCIPDLPFRQESASRFDRA